MEHFARSLPEHDRQLSRAIARAFLAGEPEAAQIVERCTTMLGRRWRWLERVIARYQTWAEHRTRPRHAQVERFLAGDHGVQRALPRLRGHIRVVHLLALPAYMQPALPAMGWIVPRIETVGALADWLWLEPSEVDWFADLKGWNQGSGRERVANYFYTVLRKRSGDLRLIEAPKPRLKKIQRQVLDWILAAVPVNEAAHGFRPGRSIRTFVAPHVGKRLVLRMDLQNFFPALSRARVQGFFRTAGYPEPVSDVLGGICTNSVAPQFWQRSAYTGETSQIIKARQLYRQPYLPQGAPTSPALANLLCYRLDCRLSGLAKTFGAQYTRYADDLAFSGDAAFERQANQFPAYIAVILKEEGFSARDTKTRFMRQGVRQHLAGLVVNQAPNISRSDFDRLKAILTNCVRQGPESQNRDRHPDFRRHLEGRIGYVESINPAKAQRLRGIAAKILWP